MNTQVTQALANYHAADKEWRALNHALLGAENPYPPREKEAFAKRQALLVRYLCVKEAYLANLDASNRLDFLGGK